MGEIRLGFLCGGSNYLQFTYLFIARKFIIFFIVTWFPSNSILFLPLISLILHFSPLDFHHFPFLITCPQATLFYLDPSFFLFCTLDPCLFFPLFWIFLYFDFKKNAIINLIRKVIKKYKMEANALKIYFYKFDFFKKTSTREK
jgi:hypothetical protein